MCVQDVFQSLLDLLGWAWGTLRTCVGEVSSTGTLVIVSLLISYIYSHCWYKNASYVRAPLHGIPVSYCLYIFFFIHGDT